ncbi:MAG: hypothetical protein IKE93_08845 [Erysipelotrichaceae bacterium]|nr:hypothetical protein [Erysipelotrichaceae bacterium]
MSKVLSILIIPAVIIIGSLRYYLFYRYAINRHLNDENYRERTHNPAPIYILLGITILTLLFSNSRNQLAINNLQNNILQLSNQIYQLDQKLSDISKKDLAVYSYGLDLISLEKQNGQYVATVRVNVYPELLHGKTEFTLKYNGESQVMKEENGVYYADISFPSAQGGGSAELIVSYGSIMQHDDIYLEGEKIMGSLLPSMNLTGSSEIRNNTFQANWTIHASNSETRKITDAVLIIDDGRIHKEFDLQEALTKGQMELSIKEKISSENSFIAEIQYHDDQGFTYTESVYSPSKPFHLEITDSEGIQVMVL